MSAHNAFVMNGTIQLNRKPHWFVQCSDCSRHYRPLQVFESDDGDEAEVVAQQHRDTYDTVRTDSWRGLLNG